MDDLRRLFEHKFGSTVTRMDPVEGDLGGSPRKIVRLGADGLSAIGVFYDVSEENVAFLEFSRHFRSHGLPVPEIYAQDLAHNVYLEEDLGDTTLYQCLSENRVGEVVDADVVDLYQRVAEILPRFQVEASRDLDFGVCYPRQRFDRQSIAWDLNYFKYHFLKLAGIGFNEQALEDDFNCLTDFLLEADRDYFLYRDFQSRNIMIKEADPYFVDYQGGRKGALQYDIASLLYDAKADLPEPLRGRLLSCYLDALSGFIELDRQAFMRHYYGYVYVRIMQALGAYGFRGFFERKPLFIESVPYAMKNIRWLLDHVELPVKTPELCDTFHKMSTSEKLNS